MARIDNLSNFLTDVAGAIKTKKGYQSSQMIDAEDFDTEIASIVTVLNQNKTITPTASQQIIEADSGYTGIGTATIEAIDYSNTLTPQEYTVAVETADDILRSATIKKGDRKCLLYKTN